MKHNTLLPGTLPLLALGMSLLLCTAPARAVTDLNGQKVDLLDKVGKGKWTVFEVWASDCHICPDGILYMKELPELYPQAELIGISTDGDAGKEAGRQAALKFIRQQDIQFPTLLSSTVEIDNFLHTQAGESLYGTPSVIIFNPEGKLRGVQAGAIIAQDIVDFIEREESAH